MLSVAQQPRYVLLCLHIGNMSLPLLLPPHFLNWGVGAALPHLRGVKGGEALTLVVFRGLWCDTGLMWLTHGHRL